MKGKKMEFDGLPEINIFVERSEYEGKPECNGFVFRGRVSFYVPKKGGITKKVELIPSKKYSHKIDGKQCEGCNECQYPREDDLREICEEWQLQGLDEVEDGKLYTIQYVLEGDENFYLQVQDFKY